MSEASYFVARMSRENEDLGHRLNEESLLAQNAVESQLQENLASQQHRQIVSQQFFHIAEGLNKHHMKSTWSPTTNWLNIAWS